MSARRPAVIFGPAARRGLRRGIGQIAGAVRPTLGPGGRIVAVERSIRSYAPSLLDDAGAIARRIIQLDDADADPGAMLLRGMLWRVREQVGDGVATAAVLFQTAYEAGDRLVAAGLDPMELRRQIDRQLPALLAGIDAAARPLAGAEATARFTHAVCHDEALAAQLGEIFALIGPDGALTIRAGQTASTEVVYVEGAHWEAPALTAGLLGELPRQTMHLEHAAVIVGDLALNDPAELAAALGCARSSGAGGLLILASTASDAARQLLAANRQVLPAAIVQVPGVRPEEQAAAIGDLCALTGARPLIRAAGQRLDRISVDDLGSARRAWVRRDAFGLASGGGAPSLARCRIAELAAARAAATAPAERGALEQRIGRLRGGSATLTIGGATPSETAARQALAERAAQTIRGALREGVVPGGGHTLLALAEQLLARRRRAECTAERAALGLLVDALRAPFATLARNGGHLPGDAHALLQQARPGYGFDLRTGALANLMGAGIMESTAVLRAVAQTALASAALALTIEVVVHRRSPPAATEP